MPERPTTDQLLAFLRGEMPEADAARFRAAVAADPHATAKMARLAEVIDIACEEPAITPPRALVAKVKALMPQTAPARAGLTERLAQAVEAVARLVFDSASAPAALGFRGGAGSRHLTYTADGPDALETEVDLMVASAAAPDRPGLVAVTGQIEPVAGDAARIVFAPSRGGTPVESSADAHGGFRAALDAGEYDIRISAGAATVVLRRVPLEV